MSYEKQTWVTGEVITADKLNHIEEGIYNNSIVSLPATLSEYSVWCFNEGYNEWQTQTGTWLLLDVIPSDVELSYILVTYNDDGVKTQNIITDGIIQEYNGHTPVGTDTGKYITKNCNVLYSPALDLHLIENVNLTLIGGGGAN